jgi:hypothetical protein
MMPLTTPQALLDGTVPSNEERFCRPSPCYCQAGARTNATCVDLSAPPLWEPEKLGWLDLEDDR